MIRRPVVIASGIFLAAALVVFFDVLVLTPDRIPSLEAEDTARIFLHWNPFAFGELAKGHVVLWNPHTFAGAPFLAGFQPGLLYPPNWLHIVFTPARAINLGIVLHVFLAGLWTFCWTRERGLHHVACVFAGLVFMFCGAHFLQLYRGHLPHLHTLIWAPLVFLAIDGVVATRELRWTLVGAVAVAMQILAGNVQYAHYTAMIAGCYAFGRWLGAGLSWRLVPPLAGIYVGGACLAAVQLWPGIAAVPESLRASLSYATAAGGALPPENMLTFAMPALLGDEMTVPYWGRWTLSETSLFVGMAACVVAVYGLVRGERWHALASAAMVVIALALAFGDHTPLFRLLYDHMPGFQSVRGVAKFGVLASAFVAMLVAIGFDRLLREARCSHGVVALTLCGGGLLVASGWMVRADCSRGGTGLWTSLMNASEILADARWYFGETEGLSTRACRLSAWSLISGGMTLVVVGVLIMASAWSRRFVYGVALVGVLEVMTYARYTRPTFDSAPVLARVEELRRMLDARGTPTARVASYDPLQYLALAAGGYDVWGSADLVLERYARFLERTQGWPIEAVLVTAGLWKTEHPLGLLRIAHRLELKDGRPALVPTALDVFPRALLVPRWQVLPNRELVLQALTERSFDPRSVVLLESDPGLPAGTGSATGPVEVRDVSTEVIEIRADVSASAILLVTDNYSADWRATSLSDPDRTYPVLPANGTFRGIPLPAGRHEIRLEYRPRAYVVGWWVTANSILLIAGAGCVAWRRRPIAAS